MKIKLIIACILILVISLAATFIIVRTGIHKDKKLSLPQVTTEVEETFEGEPVEMSTAEIVSLYNEAFNNTAKKEIIISNGHFFVDRDRSSWIFGVSGEKSSVLQLNLFAYLLEYSDYEMKGLQIASLTPEDILYSSARENAKSIELKIKTKECDFNYERYFDIIKSKNIPVERTGFGAADIYNVFEAVGEKGDDETFTLGTGTFNNRNDYAKYGPALLNCIIDKQTRTIIECKMNYDLLIKSDYFYTKKVDGSYGSNYSDIELYINAYFSYPYIATMPMKNGTTVSQ